MFLFAKNYHLSIINDFSNKVNLSNFKLLNKIQGESSNISFLNSKIKKQHKNKLKNLLILEFISLQKSFLKNDKNRGLKKTIYVMTKSLASLKKAYAFYFLYNFSKIYIGAMHTLLKFGLTLKLEQREIALKSAFDLIYKNSKYFSNIIDLNYEKAYTTKAHYNLVYLSFFKLSI